MNLFQLKRNFKSIMVVLALRLAPRRLRQREFKTAEAIIAILCFKSKNFLLTYITSSAASKKKMFTDIENLVQKTELGFQHCLLKYKSLPTSTSTLM